MAEGETGAMLPGFRKPLSSSCSCSSISEVGVMGTPSVGHVESKSVRLGRTLRLVLARSKHLERSHRDLGEPCLGIVTL